MERGIKGAIPEFANMLEEQEAMGEIPKPREVADEVREDIIV
jgi:hypothetical protein